MDIDSALTRQLLGKLGREPGAQQPFDSPPDPPGRLSARVGGALAVPGVLHAPLATAGGQFLRDPGKSEARRDA